MPPLCPTMATGPLPISPMRSSGTVSRRWPPAMLPMQLGPETARPLSAISVFISAAVRKTAPPPLSPKPPAKTVALRAPALAPSRRVAAATLAGTITSMWSGFSGRLETLG